MWRACLKGPSLNTMATADEIDDLFALLERPRKKAKRAAVAPALVEAPATSRTPQPPASPPPQPSSSVASTDGDAESSAAPVAVVAADGANAGAAAAQLDDEDDGGVDVESEQPISIKADRRGLPAALLTRIFAAVPLEAVRAKANRPLNLEAFTAAASHLGGPAVGTSAGSSKPSSVPRGVKHALHGVLLRTTGTEPSAATAFVDHGARAFGAARVRRACLGAVKAAAVAKQPPLPATELLELHRTWTLYAAAVTRAAFAAGPGPPQRLPPASSAATATDSGAADAAGGARSIEDLMAAHRAATAGGGGGDKARRKKKEKAGGGAAAGENAVPPRPLPPGSQLPALLTPQLLSAVDWHGALTEGGWGATDLRDEAGVAIHNMRSRSWCARPNPLRRSIACHRAARQLPCRASRAVVRSRDRRLVDTTGYIVRVGATHLVLAAVPPASQAAAGLSAAGGGERAAPGGTQERRDAPTAAEQQPAAAVPEAALYRLVGGYRRDEAAWFVDPRLGGGRWGDTSFRLRRTRPHPSHPAPAAVPRAGTRLRLHWPVASTTAPGRRLREEGGGTAGTPGGGGTGPAAVAAAAVAGQGASCGSGAGGAAVVAGAALPCRQLGCCVADARPLALEVDAAVLS
jgi:hypothetical protein